MIEVKQEKMAKQLSDEVKFMICKLAQKKWSASMICKHLSEENLKASTVYRVISNFKNRGTHERKTGSGRKPIKNAIQDKIRHLIES